MEEAWFLEKIILYNFEGTFANLHPSNLSGASFLHQIGKGGCYHSKDRYKPPVIAGEGQEALYLLLD